MRPGSTRARSGAAVVGVACFLCLAPPYYAYYGDWGEAFGLAALMGVVAFGGHFLASGRGRSGP